MRFATEREAVDNLLGCFGKTKRVVKKHKKAKKSVRRKR